VSKNLLAAIHLITPPERHTTEAYARDADGFRLDGGRNPKAVCWCILGAMDKCGVNEVEWAALVHYAREEWCIFSLTDLNDGEGGHARALQAMWAVQVSGEST